MIKLFYAEPVYTDSDPAAWNIEIWDGPETSGVAQNYSTASTRDIDASDVVSAQRWAEQHLANLGVRVLRWAETTTWDASTEWIPTDCLAVEMNGATPMTLPVGDDVTPTADPLLDLINQAEAARAMAEPDMSRPILEFAGKMYGYSRHGQPVVRDDRHRWHVAAGSPQRDYAGQPNDLLGQVAFSAATEFFAIAAHHGFVPEDESGRRFTDNDAVGVTFTKAGARVSFLNIHGNHGLAHVDFPLDAHASVIATVAIGVSAVLVDPRCPTCDEPLRLIRSGAVGHSGDEHGNNCPTT